MNAVQKSNAFDKMTVDTWDVSRFGSFLNVNDTLMKKYNNTRIKSENCLVLAYQISLSSGAHNSVHFQMIQTCEANPASENSSFFLM